MNKCNHLQNPERIKKLIPAVDFYTKELQLTNLGYRSGKWATAGLCPFHEDTRAGSFKINVETGAFKCWSCGARGNDIISFLQTRDGLSFPEVLQNLSIEWGVTDA